MQKPTYKDLNTWLEHAIQERDHLSVKVETLQDDLEKTHKALDVAVDALTYINTNMVIAENVYFPETDKIVVAQKALKQIKTALEQKDVK